jgi:nucleotide-binding universal stress UspA family protein
MFRSIVVGTDGSERSSRAVLAAAELAATQPGAVLHIVTVQRPVSATAVAAGEMTAAAPVSAERDWEAEIRKELEATLERAAATAERACDTRIETHARLGSPAEVLCDLAAHLDADLIVVGNRGMQGGRRFLGSVPNTVSHHAPCSVLIVDTHDTDPADDAE